MSSQTCTSGHVKVLNSKKARLRLTDCESRGSMKKKGKKMHPNEDMGQAVIFLVY